MEIELLPFRVENRLATLLGTREADLTVVQEAAAVLPKLRCVLRQPAASDVSILLRVHTRSGIPLAVSSIDVSRGGQVFETPGVTLLAMEGYAHLAPAARHSVEARIWSRRAYATASAI